MVEIASAAVPADNSRPWLVLKIQAVFHAVLGMVVGVAPLYAQAQHRPDPVALTGAYVVLLAAWLITLALLRRKSTRLRRELPRPRRSRHSLLQGAFPCLQLLGLLIALAVPQGDVIIAVLALSGVFLFALILLSGVCFGLAAVPIHWGAWGMALGSSFVVGLILLTFAFRLMHWSC